MYSRQLKAVRATRKMLEREVKEGKTLYRWDGSICPLCIEFTKDCRTKCPFAIIMESREYSPCYHFMRNEGCEDFYYGSSTPLDESLSFIIQLEMFYKEELKGADIK